MSTTQLLRHQDTPDRAYQCHTPEGPVYGVIFANVMTCHHCRIGIAAQAISGTGQQTQVFGSVAETLGVEPGSFVDPLPAIKAVAQVTDDAALIRFLATLSQPNARDTGSLTMHPQSEHTIVTLHPRAPGPLPSEVQ